jgi:hypothetical protein
VPRPYRPPKDKREFLIAVPPVTSDTLPAHEAQAAAEPVCVSDTIGDRAFLSLFSSMK